MAKSGASFKPGERPTGRGRNVPNKATVERAEIARMQTEESKRAGRKLGKEVLEEFMLLFAGLAAQHQPLPPGVEIVGRVVDEAKFLRYAELAVTTAKALADFQSPKFRAIMVTAPAPDQPRDVTPGGGNVLQLTDAVATARVYQQMMRQVG